MTNILFSIVVALVTNTSEKISYPLHRVPCPTPSQSLGCLVLHWDEDKTAEPISKTLTTTIFRVTNAVEYIQIPEIDHRAPLRFEIGREKISETSESLVPFTTKTWRRQSGTIITNFPGMVGLTNVMNFRAVSNILHLEIDPASMVPMAYDALTGKWKPFKLPKQQDP